MKARFAAKLRGFICCMFALMMSLALATSAWATTTTLETGPLTPHEPQTYVYDMRTAELTYKSTGKHVAWGFDDGKCPILLPGDSVEVIPQPNVPNGNMHKGFGIVTNENYPDATEYDSRGPIEVTEKQFWGGAYYITGFKIVGDYPVHVWSNSGGDHSAEQVSDEVSYTYAISYMDFQYFIPSVSMRYEVYSNAADRVFTNEELATAAYYSDEENPTTVFAEDALANTYADNWETVGMTVRRPYIEGYFFYSGTSDWVSGSDVYGFRGPYWEKQVDGISYNWWEGWYDNQATIYPQWYGGPSGNQVLSGSSDDYLFLRFRYDKGRTMTLDACGGTIDGYPTHIYEAEGRIFGARLNEGTMDAELASGVAWTPVREGYVFAGWYEDAAYTTPMTSFKETLDKYKADADDISQRACHLYARWMQFSSVELPDKAVYYSGKPVAMDGAQVQGSTGKVSYAYFADQDCKTPLDAAQVVEPGEYWVQASVEADDTHAAAQSNVAKLTVVALQEMYRMYNPYSGEHFYTAKAAERDQLVKVGWKYEGVGWIAPAVSDAPVYRLYNSVAGDHHYTMNAGEREALLKIPGWKDEGIGWYSAPEDGGVPLYRQYNPNAKTGSHNYTTKKAENDALVRLGWKAEGIGWYGVAQ